MARELPHLPLAACLPPPRQRLFSVGFESFGKLRSKLNGLMRRTKGYAKSVAMLKHLLANLEACPNQPLTAISAANASAGTGVGLARARPHSRPCALAPLPRYLQLKRKVPDGL